MRNVKAEAWSGVVRPVKLQQKASAANSAILANLGPGKAVWRSRDYAQFAKEGYTENADGYACINWLATAISGIEFHAYTKTSKDERKSIEEGPAADIVARPNPTQSWAAFIKQFVINILTTGNAYIERVGPSPNRPPLELWLQRPDRMRVIAGDAQNLVRGYDYQPQAQIDTGKNPLWLPDMLRRDGRLQPVHTVLHVKFYDPLNDFYGLSPMSAAARSIDQNNAAEEWNASILQNGGRPSGVLSGNFNAEQQDTIEDAFRKKHGGSGNVGRTLVISGEDVNYTQFSMTAQEMSWLEGQEHATNRICAIFRVPPELIGSTKFKTFNNVHEARQSGYMEGALPLLDLFVGEVNHWLAPFYGDAVEFGYDKDDIEALQEDRQYVADRGAKYVAGGIMTPNMALKAIGAEPLPAEVGDVLYVSTNVVPTKLDGKPPIALMPQPAALPPGQQPNQLVPPRQPRPTLVPARNPRAANNA